jgi:hypothetical protein
VISGLLNPPLKSISFKILEIYIGDIVAIISLAKKMQFLNFEKV